MEPKFIIGDRFVKTVCPLIKDSKKIIDIIVFYWTLSLNDLNDPVTIIIKELQEALGRGVVVRILVNNYKIGDKLSACGFRVRHCYTSKLMHPKVMILDKQTAIVGSHNYTMSGMSLNMEVSVIVKMKSVENDLCTFFNNLWGI